MSNKLLLNELNIANDNRIKDAINRVLRVRIVYNDKKPYLITRRRGYKTRYILPVAYGLTKNGKPAIRAYQTAGSTKRGFPKWKLFLLDNIVSWTNGTRSFKKYKDALINLGLNTSGDKGMTTLYAITPFANSDVQVKQTSADITSGPLRKNDIVPTTASQIPSTTSTPNKGNMEPAKNSRVSSIDKTKNNSYFNNKVEAPPTEPIKKVDIDGVPENEPEASDSTTNFDMASTQEMPGTEPVTNNEPITKKDVQPDETEDIKNRFSDLMDRMNNLYKDNEEEKD